MPTQLKVTHASAYALNQNICYASNENILMSTHCEDSKTLTELILIFGQINYKNLIKLASKVDYCCAMR